TAAPAPPSSLRAKIRARVAELRARQFVRAPVGPLRLAQGQLAAQTGWLWPLALAGLALGLAQAWPRRRQGPRQAPSPAGLSLVFWLAWLTVYAMVYSALGGIIHFYYLTTLAPALAVLASLGARGLWQRFGQGGWQAAGLPLALAITALWQVQVQASALGWSWAHLFATRLDWLRALHLGLAVGALVACAALVLAPRLREGRAVRAWLGRGGLGLGLAALLALPMAWTVAGVLAPANGIMPAADLFRLIAGPRLAQLHQRQEAQRAADLSRLVRSWPPTATASASCWPAPPTRWPRPSLLRPACRSWPGADSTAWTRPWTPSAWPPWPRPVRCAS
ncbi:MAG: hypothetical protein V1797_02285, partial [Pseudomonadota bacterium]